MRAVSTSRTAPAAGPERPVRRPSLRAPGAALAAGLLLTLLAGGDARAQAQTLRKVTFGIPNATITASYCMLPTAIRMGFFAAEGLDVTLQAVQGTATIYQTMQSGRLDIAGATPEPLVQMYARGDRSMIDVYNFIRRPTGSLAVLDDSPIRKLEDFKGKKIGAMNLGSSNIMLSNSVLAKVGINPKAELSYLGVGVGSQALQALRNGAVDALALSDQYYVEMESVGAKLRYFFGPDQEKLFSTQIMLKRSVVETDPNFVRGFGRALAKGTLVAKVNPEACVRMMWQALPSTRAPGKPEADQLKTDLAILAARMTLLVTPDSEAHGWGWYNKQDWEAWNDFALSGGLIEKKVEDVEAMYTNQFVPAYNDFDKDDVTKRAREWRG